MKPLSATLAAVALAGLASLPAAAPAQTSYPIQYGFLWHMHQPNYYPYLPITQIESGGYYSFSVIEVHNNRFGPYTTWPKDAVQSGTSLPHLGAQVSFTGSLIENLNTLRDNGHGQWNNWQAGYLEGIALDTTLGNPRLDMVAFGFHHPLMPLLDKRDMQMQIRLHKYIYTTTWPGQDYSKGMFPAENAFSTRMIEALTEEGIEWVMVDNIHFDRACVNYPHTNASNLFAPNKADVINPDPAANGGAWVQLQNVWAPSKVSAPFGYQPHMVQQVNPETGDVTKMVAVPTARYEGNEDGRGGYGAFLYATVMDVYRPFNTDPEHPMFVVLHHDGDNYGGGTEAYYHSNFQNMISWDAGDANYECSTVNDYLERFPVNPADVIHVEPGSWSGADNGDPEFKKWLGDPNPSGWSPDRNSWAVMTAARNRVFMADDISPATNMAGVYAGNGSNTEKAWRFLLCGQASDHWYWDGTEVWDSNVTRACNQAVAFADLVIAGQDDTTPPAIFPPQREPYNPGGYEWAASPMPSDFEVWTYAYDVSGLASVTLKWRVDNDGTNPLSSIQNETYAGGSEVGAWQSIAMSARPQPPRPAGILAPTYIADQYYAEIAGQNNVLIDYYVEAVDSEGNIHKSDITHVWVGQSQGGGDERVITIPEPLIQGQQATISYENEGGPLAGASTITIHYGYNNWLAGTIADVVMTFNATSGRWEATLTMPADRTQFDCVFNNGGGTWDNNSGADWHFPIEPEGTETSTPTATPTPSPTGGGPTQTPSLTPTPSPTPSPSPTQNPNSRVLVDPYPLVQNQNGLVSYEDAGGPIAGAAAVTIHYGYDNWQSATITDSAMTFNATSGRWEITIPIPGSRTQFDCVFNNGSGTWDNNGGADWHFVIVPQQATATPSLTPTVTATPSVTATISPTATETISPTPSPEETATPSISATPTETETPTPTAVESATATTTASPSPSDTPVVTATASETPTASPTAVPSVTPTAATPSPTDVPSITSSPSATATPIVVPRLTIIGVLLANIPKPGADVLQAGDRDGNGAWDAADLLLAD